MTKVKICGVTGPGDARAAIAAGAWAIGVNFWPKSARFIDRQKAQAIADEIAGAVPLVGVFVDAERESIERLVGELPLDMIQLHGSESPQDCAGWDVPVVKAVAIKDPSSWSIACGFAADFVLADAYVRGVPGGSGRRIASELIGPGMRDRLILAGGLDPDNVAELIHQIGPFAVDVASGVEAEPGVKDHEKMKRFIDNAHDA